MASAAAGAVSLAVMAASVDAYPRPGTIERVSVASDGSDGNNHATTSFMTTDGRHVVFTSFASNLVPGDHNGTRDVFVRDRLTGTIERVSVASDDTEANGISISPPAINADGRFVAFPSYASNLVPGDTNGTADVFVRDRLTGTTELVSVTAEGTEGNGASAVPVISADGRFVAFNSYASNFVPDDTNGIRDVFVHDRQTSTTERVTVASDGTQANGDSVVPAISSDGRLVAFDSLASNLVAGDLNGMRDIFVRDRDAGTTERVSVASDGTEGNRDAGWGASISGDDRYVAFYGGASNLVPGDGNNFCGSVTVEIGGSPTGVENCTDVFVHDRATRITERVSVSSDGAEGNRASEVPSISTDGRFVAFQSDAFNLVPGDTNTFCGFSGTWNCSDVFVHDRETGTTERVSVGAGGTEANNGSGATAIAPDGRYVVFDSLASNLVPGDVNARRDIFVHERGPAIGVGGVAVEAVDDGLMVSGWATFSGATVAEADDSEEDGVDPTGAELVGASVIHRPELDDLLLRLPLASLPGPIVGGSPAVVYRWTFTAGGTAYEVRMTRVWPASEDPSADPYVALYRCAPSCAEVSLLSGGMGATGAEVRVSVPLAALGAAGGSTLKGLEASATLADTSNGPVVVLDRVTLPDAALPAPRVGLGIAPTSSGAEDVTFTVVAELVEGRFSGTLEGSSLPAGAFRVWARACLDDACGAQSVQVTR